MRRIVTMLAATGLVAALAFAAPLTATPGNGNSGNKYDAQSPDPHVCSNADGTVGFTGALKMWPPNHKYQPIAITADADDENSEVTLDTAGTHDELIEGEEMNGAGNTGDDINPAADTAMDSMGAADEDGDGNGIAITNHELRSERSGQGDGRTYTIDALATFDGEPCEVEVDPETMEETAVAVTFVVEVPHDMRGGADWK